MKAKRFAVKFGRIFVVFLIWCAIVYVRTRVGHNIKPWEFLWVVWVLSTTIAGGCIGWMLHATIYDGRKK